MTEASIVSPEINDPVNVADEAQTATELTAATSPAV